MINEKRNPELLRKVGIVPRIFCPKCEIRLEYEYDYCIKCGHTLRVSSMRLNTKKRYFDCMGLIESMMYQRMRVDRKNKEMRLNKLCRVYSFEKTRLTLGVVSKNKFLFWNHTLPDKEIEKLSLDEVHRYQGHRWDRWNRVWIKESEQNKSNLGVIESHNVR